MKTLYPVQREAVDRMAEILRRHGSVLNSSDTGTGKTLMSVELARDLGIAPLVVCPKAVIPSWQRTFDEQGVDYLGVVNYESLRTGNTIFGRWEGPEPKKSKPKKDPKTGKMKPGRKTVDRRPFKWSSEVICIIWDECHKTKSSSSQAGRMLRFAKHPKILNVLVSATAASNPSEMKAIGFHLGLHSYVDFGMWAKQHGCSLDPWGNLKFTTSLKRATEVLTDIRREIYPERGVKVSRADLAEFFTEMTLLTDPLDFGDEGKIDSLYEEVAKFMAELEEKEALDDPAPAAEALIAMLRARQRIELLKVPVIVEMTQEAIAEGMHVVIALNFNDTVRAVAEKLGGNVPIIWGADPLTKVQQTDTARQAAIDAFQSNSDNVLILNIEAGGVGVSLHDEVGGAPRLALISPTWNEKSLHQVLGRVDRAGAKTDTLQRILYAANTVEEDVRVAMLRKLENLQTLHNTADPAMPPKKKADKPAPAADPVTIDIKDVEELNEEGEPAHAQYGPSSLKYFETCPSYLNRGDSGDNTAAAQGTRIHEALEYEDPEGLEDPEEIHLGRITLDQAFENETNHGVRDGEIHKEIRLYIDLHHHQTFGTLDRLAIKGRIAVAQDYKFGVNPVDPAEVNAQAWAYSLGIFQKFPEVEIIYFYFLAPKQNEMTFAIFTRDENVEPEDFWAENDFTPAATLDDIRLRVNVIISRSEEQAALPVSERTYNPQNHVCEFCGFKERCQALTNKALVIARDLEPGLNLPEHLSADDTDDPAELGQLLMIARVMFEWAEATKKRVNARHREDGVEADGFTWRTKKTSRTINDPLAAFNVLVETFGLDEKDFAPRFLEAVGTLSIEGLEKIFKSLAKTLGEEFPEAAIETLRENEILTGGDVEIGFFQIDRKKK